ncbi:MULTISPECIES: hypothetical protein [unclassified Shewanella]|uniref:hypothetical protein n=1 Tax=unclassified Shewanella TaxID=196818 RepID=UPI001BBB4218|nr:MULTISPECIES: hypothetical protein [unclassified Shewanella]GIU05334.1 hypothetical protein TUM4444_01520 [Shewanella sp. MBTL60-112-B1]GIU24111.1 hypothetical protein TUM4445_00850 [Shewanella sp. MBTL60-112-B2]
MKRDKGLTRQKPANLIAGGSLILLGMFTSAAFAKQEIEERLSVSSTINTTADQEQVLPEPEKPQQGDTQVVVQVREGWQYTYRQRFDSNGTWLTLEMNKRLIAN